MAEEKAKKTMNPVVKQWVIPIAVLVVICLVCGALLALCNDLLFIDDDTRLERAMQKVYPTFKLKEELDIVAENAFNPTFGKVNRVLLSTDGAYIIEALGSGGYQNGSVTLYVIIGADAKIKGWAVKDNDKQSYIDRVPSSAGSSWYVGEDASVDKTLDKVMTGATVTFTATAIQNAVNMATYYYRAVILGNDPEGDAKEAVVQLLAENDFNYDSITAIASVKKVVGTALDSDTDKLAYMFSGDGDKGKIYAYVYGADENLKIVVVTETGILTSNCDETSEIVNLIKSNPVREIEVTSSIKLYTFMTGAEAKESAMVYTVVGITGSGYTPENYTLNITIENGEVTDIEVAKSGYVPGPPESQTDSLVEGLKGATLDNFDAKYEAGIVTDASQSGHIIAAAVKAALIDYARIAQED